MIKKLLTAAGLFVICATTSLAADLYVDSGCTNNGNGTAIDCAGSVGAAGPWSSLANMNAGSNFACGNTVHIRGVHSTHGSNHAAGTTDGRYSAGDGVDVNENCGSGSPLIIQAYGWTAVGAGTEEVVYTESTAAPGTGAALGWTQCADCSAGSAVVACRNVPSTCGDVWWTIKTATGNPGGQILMIGAQRPDGAMTYRELPACTGADLGVQWDSCSAQTDGATLAVRWGTGADAPGGASNLKPYVFYDNDGNVWDIDTESYLTIRGTVMRCSRRSLVSADNANHITIQDNTMLYIADKEQNGSDHAFTANNSTDMVIDSNEMAYSGSELIHTQASDTEGASVYTITNNYLHDNGDTSMGPGVTGTPSMMIIGGFTSEGNYSGSVMSGNVMINSQSNGSSQGFGVILENHADHWVIRDNLFKHIGGECIKLEAVNGTVSDNKMFNNIFIDCAYQGGSNGNAITLKSNGTSGLLIDDNLTYNNTFIDNVGGGYGSSCPSTYCNDNIVANNIFYKSSSWTRQVNWGNTDSTNLFLNNLIYGPNVSSNNAVQWLGTNYTCATINSGNLPGTDNNLCSDPKFSNATAQNYHLARSSPAVNAGTSTSMPSARTSSICNTIVAALGFPKYSDCIRQQGSAWDIGAIEFRRAFILSDFEYVYPTEPSPDVAYVISPPEN